MEAHGELDQPLVEQVAPPVMGQLVEGRTAKIRLAHRRRGQDDPGPEQPQQHGGGGQGIFPQLHGPPDLQLLPGPGQQVQQGGVGDLPASGPETAEKMQIGAYPPHHQDQRAAQPGQGQRLRRGNPVEGPVRRGNGGLRRRERLWGGSGPGGNRFRRIGTCGLDGGRGFRFPEQRSDGACFRRQGQQQPEDGDEPDIVLPAAADPPPEQGAAQQQDQNDQGPGEGQGDRDL